MSETVRLKASDGHELDAYVSEPSDEPIAGLVVIQEAFGVNRHIRSVPTAMPRTVFSPLPRHSLIELRGAWNWVMKAQTP
jgi:hypothetical protein